MYGSLSEETWDFVRCVRSNGTYYGTKGKCRKGREAPERGKEGRKLYAEGAKSDISAIERKAEEWRNSSGLKAEAGSVDWKHDRVHVLVHDFLGSKEAIGEWFGTRNKSPTPAEEALVNIVHRAAALKGRGEFSGFTDRDLARYFTRDIQCCWGRGQISDKEYHLYFKENEDGLEMPDVNKFITKYREMEKKPGFEKLLDAAHAMWTEAGDLLL